MQVTAPASSSAFSLCGFTRNRRQSRCGSISVDSPPKRPDLAIYSQLQAVAESTVLTWNNPDISEMWSHSPPYWLVKARIRNLSTEASAINSLVHLFLAPFGIGTSREYIETQQVSLAPGEERELTFRMGEYMYDGTPAAAVEVLRLGKHIVIEHPHDQRSINNYGSEVKDQRATYQFGRVFTVEFPVINDSPSMREIALRVLPSDLIGEITSPASPAFRLAPHEEITAILTFEVPDTLHGGTSGDHLMRDITVVAEATGVGLIGGFTTEVIIND